MTALTPNLAAAVAGICAEIDAGRGELLGVLADALEEAGDPLAAGLRRAKAPRKGGYSSQTCYYVGPPEQADDHAEPHEVGPETLARLASHPDCLGRISSYMGDQAVFASRSAALLALAEALTPRVTQE